MRLITKISGLVVLIVLTTGCSSMSASFDSFKYGKLYAMQGAFDEAIENSCQDKEIRMKAVNWAAIGYNDLNQSKQYIHRDSEEYGRVRSVMSSLSLVTSRRMKSHEVMCSRIEQVAQVTREFLAKVDGKQEIVVASRK